MLRYIDVHAHLHDKAFDEDRDAVIKEMGSLSIGAITVGTDYEESKKALALANKYDNLWATVGFHPVDNKEEIFDITKYEELAYDKKVVAIGECGLDYYWPTLDGLDIEKEKERQKKIFIAQIELAKRIGKPLMLHGRPSKGTMDAYVDMLEILNAYKGGVRGNAHFFVGDTKIAQGFLDLGFTMSFPGVITFAKELEETVSFVPLTSMHAETDSPYATPKPHRGKRNSSLYLPYILEKIAEVKNISKEEVERGIRQNTERLFGF
jgi:TatD DNase family protein